MNDIKKMLRDPTDAEIDQFIKEFDEGKHPLSDADKSALATAGFRQSLRASIELADKDKLIAELRGENERVGKAVKAIYEVLIPERDSLRAQLEQAKAAYAAEISSHQRTEHLRADLRAQLETARQEIERLKDDLLWARRNTALAESDRDKALRVAEEAEKENQRVAAGVTARFTAPIICLCGSTRFIETWIGEYQRLSDAGNIVLSVARMPPRPKLQDEQPELKERLDWLHKRKIDLCDWVWVLDVGGYIGASTKSEILYAQQLGKSVRYLSQEVPDYVEPVAQSDLSTLRGLVDEMAEVIVAYKQKANHGQFMAATAVLEKHTALKAGRV